MRAKDLRKFNFFAFFCLCLYLFPLHLGATDVDKKWEMGKLSQILKNTVEYCKKLEDFSLYYYCREGVKETIYPIPKKYRGSIRTYIGIHGEFSKFFKKSCIINEYLYDYQMIRKGSKKMEKRVLLKENGKKRNKKNARLKTQCFKYATIVYGPQIFEEKEQGFYSFKILRRDKWQNRYVLVVQALPKMAVQKDLLWGEFWVDEKNFAILKIEMSQKAIGNYYKIEERAMVLNSEPCIKTVMEYGVEKNGIQFPSKFSIEEAYINPRGEKIVLSELLVAYNDYRFFKVGLNVKYRKSKKIP